MEQQHALVIDYKYCTGCHTCEISCRKEKNLPIDEWGIKVCEQGPAVIEGNWMWNYVPVPSQACDLCADRRAEGKEPLCVLHCLAACMKVVPLSELPQTMGEMGDGVTCFIPSKPYERATGPVAKEYVASEPVAEEFKEAAIDSFEKTSAV